ncbi:hypothetical protein Y032_0052g2217 [Ancylostoma ceylanicum]|uniref:Uncharacterized protein n=1 Tax=Ancylostoma ceylanicum TaxID=53326 RepID=A0A016U7H2_9BILA|nr:hypothetical protein Y032_0052g2217 [Ancylostoma ceylanicum]
MGRDGYDRVVPGKPDKPSAKKGGIEESTDTSGISGMVNVSGGCDSILESKTPAPAKRNVKTAAEAAVSNRSKVNVLVTILAVVFTQFIICIIAVAIIILHHVRAVDWFPALIEVTGKGYLTETPDDY